MSPPRYSLEVPFLLIALDVLETFFYLLHLVSPFNTLSGSKCAMNSSNLSTALQFSHDILAQFSEMSYSRWNNFESTSFAWDILVLTFLVAASED